MQNSGTGNGGRSVKSMRRMLLVSILVFGIGFVGYLLTPRGLLISYILAHLGALGALGLFGWFAGFIAMKKGRSFYSKFLWTSMLPIPFGGSAVLIAGDSVTCGGSISLATAVVILAASFFLKKKQTMTEVS